MILPPNDAEQTVKIGMAPVVFATAKAVLRTMEGVNWQAAPELKKPRSRKP